MAPRTRARVLEDLKRRREVAWKRCTWRRFFDLLRQAAALRDPEALFELGTFYRDGLCDRRGRAILRPSAVVSARLFRRAAELGDTDGMDALASYLSEPWMSASGRPPRSRSRLVEAFRWYHQALARGRLETASNLAVNYQNLGHHRQAVHWFRRAAAAGDESALFDLAKAELYGLGCRRNVTAALEKLRRVGDERNSGVSPFEAECAMVLMGKLLMEGWLVKRDYRAGLYWLRRAAAWGSAAAAGLLNDLNEPET